MADPAPATLQQGPSIDAILGASNKNISTLLGRESAQAKDETQQLQGIDQREATDEGAIDRQMAGVKVPTLPNDATKPFSPPPQTDPKAVWASTAMLMAGLGSLFTRQPLTTAMNAAAGVIKAYRDGDTAAAQSAFTQWKTAQDAALKIANFEQDTYRNLIDQLRDMRDATGKDAEAKRRDIMAQFNAQGIALQDQVAAQEKSADEAIRVFDARQGWAKTLALNGSKIEEQSAYHQAVDALKKDPKFIELAKKNPIAAYREIMALEPQSMKPATPDQQAVLEDRIVQQIKTDPIYKNWAATAISSQEIQRTLAGLQDGSISETVAADQFTRSFNGANAIRGFQQKMLTDHASLYQQAQIFAKKFQNGGFLSNDQLAVMAQAAQLSANFLNNQMAATVMAAQSRAIQQGLDPLAVVPDDFKGYVAENLGAFPPGSFGVEASAAPAAGGQDSGIDPQAVDMLKKDPSLAPQFDEHFGPGAAERILGQ